jgi:hypothetical protein
MNTRLHLDERIGLARQRDLILGGIPVARGELTTGGWFTLADATGGKFPVEGTPAAYWPDGSVKWLHLCGLADLAGGQRNTFDLIPAPSVPQEALTVQCLPGEVRIRGGALDVDIGCEAQRLLRVKRPGGEAWLTRDPGLSAVMTYVDPEGTNRRRYDLRVKAENPEVAVCTANRVVVRLPCQFEDEQGLCVAELILFIEIFREMPEIRLEPVWIYLGLPNRDLVESLTLTAHLPLAADECAYTFSDERGPGTRDVIQRVKGATPEEGDGPRWPLARLLQSGSSFYRTDKQTFAKEASWVKAVEGRRAQGWCHVTDGKSAVTAAMRYFWQEYPHALEIDCDQGTIGFGLIPSGAAPLDLRRYSPQVYGGVVYEAGKRGPFAAETHGARGIAKAHELMLRFHEPDEKDIAVRGLSFIHPCRPVVVPAQFAGSRVVGRLVPSDPPVDQRAEQLLADIADFIVAEREVRGWYGLMDFGDVQMDFRSAEDRWGFDDGGYAWLNTEGLPDHGLWLSALRGARTDWLEAAIEMSRHNRDVDVYHRGELRGVGTRHNVNHWGCPDKEWRISMPLVRRLHYYVTADPWTAEVIRNTVAVYQSHERTAVIAPSMTAAVSGILTKWEMSGDPADGEVVRRLGDAYARAVRADGQFIQRLHANLATGDGHPEGDNVMGNHFFMDSFGGQHVLVDLAELTDHQELSAAIVRYAEFRIGIGRAGRDVMLFMAHAYRATQDPRFLDAVRAAMEKEMPVPFVSVGGDGILDVPRHRMVPDLGRRNKMMCHVLGDPMQFLPYGLALGPAPTT